jgi:hypothetical protein
MDSAVQEVISEITAGVEDVNIIAKAGKKVVASKGVLNVVATEEDRHDLVAQGWSHRGVVGGNVYYKQG